MNILVTGGNGQLGNSIKKIITLEFSNSDHYFFTDIEDLDITDLSAVSKFIEKNKIDIIINCAAYTNVDKAEKEPETAELINSAAVSNLASAIKVNNGTLIHISTDYVFNPNSHNTPLKEEMKANPFCVYGISKYHGELEIQKSQAKAIIIRTSWLYSEFGKNFFKTIQQLTSCRSELNVVVDQVGTPTYATDLAKFIINIIKNRKFEGNEGVYHFSNEGVCSWYDFAVAIRNLTGNNSCKITPCHSSEYASNVVRPAYSVLDKTKVKSTFSILIPHWQESLHSCIINYNYKD